MEIGIAILCKNVMYMVIRVMYGRNETGFHQPPGQFCLGKAMGGEKQR